MRKTYINGCVYTGDGWVESFTVENGRFLCVGKTADVPEDKGELVDLQGRFVCAGFNDSHMHLLNFGYSLTMANLTAHTASLAELLDYLRRYMAASDTGGDWILGRGFNHDYFEDQHRFPTRYDLDSVSADRPICITRACGHILVVNSKALELLGITRDTPQPEGGRFSTDESGEPLGQFFENALGMVLSRIPLPDDDALRRMLLTAARRLNAYGITSCQSDDYEAFPDLGYKRIMHIFEELSANGTLPVRVNEQAHFTNIADLRAFVASGDFKRGNAYFKNGPLKMLGDGSLGARTAYLSRPYNDCPNTRGIAVYTQRQFDEMCDYANQNGMQIAIHAIGDGILDCVLDAYEKALAHNPRADHRHGIVHCQITRPDQIERLQKLQLHVYAQSIFLDYDTHIVHARVGGTLAASSYAAKTLLEKGISLSNGSDAPVEEPVALRGIECAVTRRSIESEDAPYRPEESLSVREALDSFTKGGAFASFEEGQKGCIREGMLADFVVLSENPFHVAKNDIHKISVLETYLDGKCVYKKS